MRIDPLSKDIYGEILGIQHGHDVNIPRISGDLFDDNAALRDSFQFRGSFPRSSEESLQQSDRVDYFLMNDDE